MTVKYHETSFEGGESSGNIYTKISREITKTPYFQLRYTQVIPKYYLLNHQQRLIIHYSMGSGKSAAAIFVATYYFDIMKKRRFLNYLNPSNEKQRTIQIIGNWTSNNAFMSDIIRPEFGLTSVEEIEEIETKIRSSYKEIREEGLEEREKMKQAISKSFTFGNYQSVFNKCFPELESQKFVQNTSSLLTGWNSKELVVDKEYLESLRDSLVIVDEMQRMYSDDGMNTYGFAIGCLLKNSVKYGIKFIFLTGTILNNSLFEVPIIMSILSLDNFINIDEYLEDEIILADSKIRTIKKSRYQDVYDYFEDIFLYYDQKTGGGEIVIKDFELPVSKKILDEIPTVNSVSNLKQIIIKSPDNSLPEERHIGNILIKGEEYMNLYALQVNGYQQERYLEFLRKDEREKQDDNMGIRDGVVDKKLDVRYSQGVYMGEGLRYANLRGYSVLGGEVIRMAIYNTLRNEKTVFYHDRIFSFGLKQYMEILNQNGFILYGTPPRPNTRCRVCGKEMSDHGPAHVFVPMRYGALYGELSDGSRKEITEIYNSPNNLYGEAMSVMFISSVAQAGVSFFNTNNMVILNKISNLSKWKQIYARVVRSHSHDLLPPEKRYANIYTFVIEDVSERSKSTSISEDEKYYRLRNILNSRIGKFILEVYKHSITDTLFKHPEKFKDSSNTERLMFENDMKKEIDIVFERLQLDKEYPWSLDSLIDRIRNSTRPMSFINFNAVERDVILNTILDKYIVKVVNYGKNPVQFCLPYKDRDSSSHKTMTTFKFTDLQYINIESKNIKNTMRQLIDYMKNPDLVNVRNVLTKLMKYSNFKPERFIDQEVFWEAIYFIHDEYYDDDHKNFVVNHTSEGRDINKMTGFYMNNMVVKKDGSMIRLDKYNSVEKTLDDMPYAFKILSYSTSESMTWYLRVVILEPNDVEDRRRINRGTSCISFKIKNLYPYFPTVDSEQGRKKYCSKLLEEVCKKVLNSGEESKLTTPFS